MATFDFNGVICECGDSPLCNMLGRLCEAQRVTVNELVQERDELQATLSGIAMQLLEEGQKRREGLVRLGEQIADKQDEVRYLAAQRDAVVEMLRALCGHLANQPITSLTYFGGEAFAKSVRHANELLTLIEQKEAARKRTEAVG